MKRDAAQSKARIRTAAAALFAAQGFDGATVDAIAADAGVNKAMVYYHFDDKLALYRDLLSEMFDAIGGGLRQVRAAGGRPDDQLRAYVGVLQRAGLERPYFPALWLREIAENGRHLDVPQLQGIRQVLGELGALLAEGQAQLGWRRVDPFLIQLGIVGPLMLFLASAGVRERFRAAQAEPPTASTPDDAAAHVTTMTLAALNAAPPLPATPTKRPARRTSR